MICIDNDEKIEKERKENLRKSHFYSFIFMQAHKISFGFGFGPIE